MAPSDPPQRPPPAPAPAPPLALLLLATLCCPAWGKGGYSGYFSTTTGYSTGYTGYRPTTTSSGYYYYSSAPRPAYLSPTTFSGGPYPYFSTEPSPPVATTGWWPSPWSSPPSPPSQPLPRPSPTPSPALSPWVASRPSSPQQRDYGSHSVASSGSRSPQGDYAGNQGDWEEEGEDEMSMISVVTIICLLFLSCLLIVSAAIACIARAKGLSGQDLDPSERGMAGYLGAMSQPVVENPQPAVLEYPMIFEGPYQLHHPDTTTGVVAGPPPLPIHEPPTFPAHSGGWQGHSLYPDLPVLE